MQNQFRSPIPTLNEYEQSLASPLFKEMEQFSNRFLSDNAQHLLDYARIWVKDPLHQWSRQWEYPYVFTIIRELLSQNDCRPATILDAGSGVTFFPYFLKSELPGLNIYCCDYDKSLVNIFHNLNSHYNDNIAFKAYDLHKMAFDDDLFDIIYCISVLEHTDNYHNIINEFHRTIRPYGKLIVTFDISLDGKDDLSPHAAKKLIDVLSARFSIDHPGNRDLDVLLSRQDLLTTTRVTTDLIPWKPPSLGAKIKSRIMGRGIPAWPPSYTVYGLSMTKKD